MAKLNQQTDEEIAPGTVIDGRYRVIRSIGQGGNGMVYEVEHTRTGRRLALKALLDQTGFARLEQEARAASLMKNGHTARIIDMEPGDSHGPYMVMELLEGQSLRGLLDEAGQLPLELTVNMAMQVCECLQEAHGLGIIHRDLKPENVYLCASPWPGQYDVKVLDFGVMKVAEGGGAIPKSSLTRTGSTVGTPYYMSLEQLRNSSAVDARADVYSLGVVLYECLTGRKPFQADTLGDLVYALCSGPPTSLTRLRPDLPAEVSDMVMRTLSANRDDRPASMLDLASALLPFANQAFSLWVRIDGKQPALSVAGAPNPAPARPGLGGLDDAPASRFNRAPPRPAAGQPAPIAPVERGGYPPPPDARMGPALAPTLLANDPPESVAPSTNHAWPPRPAEDSGRRDTPTEMYVKGVHGAPAEEASAPVNNGNNGDRDTPTRAYEMPSLPGPGPGARPPMAMTLKSPVGAGMDDGNLPTSRIEEPIPQAQPSSPRFGAPPLAVGATGGAGGASPLNAPAGALMTMPIGKQTVPLGNIMPALQLPPPPSQPSPVAPVAPSLPESPAKPAWQRSLDRALLGVGRTGDDLARRFRAAPQNTQIIILIVAATVAFLIVGGLFFLIVR